jgi:hypothetical protein
VPSPEEIAEVALRHILVARNPVVSFGQGCEGEPLMVSDTIREAIRLIRTRTQAGTINLNTNASLPARWRSSPMRGGQHAHQHELGAAADVQGYFRPSYPFEALAESAREMKGKGQVSYR